MNRLWDPSALCRAMENGSFSLRLLDCTFLPGPRATPDKYAHGKFEEPAPNTLNYSRAKFLADHIPGSIHFDLALATHPTKYEQYAHYPAKIFEQYVQKLGLNSNDHLVLYGRGFASTGAICAARAYWLFKSYGHENLLFLDGGYEAWLADGLPVEVGAKHDDTVFALPRGDWQAKTEPTDRMISFEHLYLQEGNFGANFTLIDCRPRDYFEGSSHLPGALNVPFDEIFQPFTDEKQLKTRGKLRAFLERYGLVDIKGKNLVLYNSGFQASMLATAMDVQLGPEYTKNLRVCSG